MNHGDARPGDRRTHLRRALLPAPKEDADPLERQRPYGGLMGLALVALLLVVHLCPEGMPDGFRGPFDERLSEERGALQAPVDPGLLAAAFGYWRDTGVFLEFLGGGIAFALFAKGDEEPGGKDGARAWQGGKEREIGMALGALRDGVVEICNSLQSDAELGDEGLHQEGIGGDDPVIGGQGCGLLMAWMRLSMTSHSARDGTEEALEGGTACELGGFESRPLGEEVAEQQVLSPETIAARAGSSFSGYSSGG